MYGCETTVKQCGGRSVKVVYIEDNANNQRLLCRMLSKRNIEIELYDNAEDGYTAIHESQPDLIFMDVHLKTKTSGLDLVRQLRHDGVDTPIILVTIFNMMADKKRALEAGCNDFLMKPFEMAQLLNLVDQYAAAS
ncbi:MAG: response regulator [Chloroflexi bacterium]|nr:response regulator [Chloroflexota bacterium]